MSLEFIRYEDGTCALMDGDELLWSSDNDDEYLGEFDASIDSDDIDDVLAWLEENEYIEPDETIDITDEGVEGAELARDDAANDDDYDDDDMEG
jgi:hypothetical protein